MVKNFKIIVTSIFVACIGSANLLASGGGYGSNDNSWGTKPTVDKKYEAGKRYFYWARVDGKKIRYCVKNGEDFLRLSRSSLKAYQNTTTRDLSDNLVNCDQPELLIVDQINSDQVSAVVYYLNKRYKLSLLSNS